MYKNCNMNILDDLQEKYKDDHIDQNFLIKIIQNPNLQKIDDYITDKIGAEGHHFFDLLMFKNVYSDRSIRDEILYNRIFDIVGFTGVNPDKGVVIPIEIETSEGIQNSDIIYLNNGEMYQFVHNYIKLNYLGRRDNLPKFNNMIGNNIKGSINYINYSNIGEYVTFFINLYNILDLDDREDCEEFIELLEIFREEIDKYFMSFNQNQLSVVSKLVGENYIESGILSNISIVTAKIPKVSTERKKNLIDIHPFIPYINNIYDMTDEVLGSTFVDELGDYIDSIYDYIQDESDIHNEIIKTLVNSIRCKNCVNIGSINIIIGIFIYYRHGDDYVLNKSQLKKESIMSNYYSEMFFNNMETIPEFKHDFMVKLICYLLYGNDANMIGVYFLMNDIIENSKLLENVIFERKDFNEVLIDMIISCYNSKVIYFKVSNLHKLILFKLPSGVSQLIELFEYKNDADNYIKFAVDIVLGVYNRIDSLRNDSEHYSYHYLEYNELIRLSIKFSNLYIYTNYLKYL